MRARPAFLASAGLADEVGIVLSARRRDAHVMYFPSARGAWVPLAQLQAATGAGPPIPAPLAALRSILDFVPAIELELRRVPQGLQVKLVTGGIGSSALAKLAELGALGLRIMPESMSKLALLYTLGGGGTSHSTTID